MKYALISPLEPRSSGYRVTDVVETTFEVAPPFYWLECSDDVVADGTWFDPVDETFKEIPQSVIIRGDEPTDPNLPSWEDEHPVAPPEI